MLEEKCHAASAGNRDIIEHPKSQPLQNISYLNKRCDALLYPLLFSTDQFGWDMSGRQFPVRYCCEEDNLCQNGFQI